MRKEGPSQQEAKRLLSSPVLVGPGKLTRSFMQGGTASPLLPSGETVNQQKNAAEKFLQDGDTRNGV